MAAAALALLALSSSGVSALSLGRITVQSALGEPLKAEVDIPSITAEEAASLTTSTAPPAAFVAAGLEYNAAMTGLQATLARKADGRAYLRLTTERAINDPFVDMILVASWSSGRIVRDYTMLFDPPSLKQAVPAPTLAQTAPASASVPAKAMASPAQPADKAAPKVRSESADVQQVTVQPGDSASKLAVQNKTNDVSLDQMLVAMLRNNPDAFIKGNLNRLRAGAVVDLPSSEQARAIPADEAAQTVVAQSKDFNEFRRNLASNAPKSTMDAPDRMATGKVEAKVDDKKPASNAADKLTLSKGALQAKADEAKIAKERADADAAARAAEIAKNIADLNTLSAATAASAPAAAPGPAATVAVAAASEPTPAAAPAIATPAIAAPAAKPPAKPQVPAMADAPEPSLVDTLLEDPTLPLAGGGLVVALGGFAFYRRYQAKKRAANADSSFLESRLQPDSFFGASGGQQVDTAQDGASSSMPYTNSQVGSADDVDPVAEADVYLAYGRDAQAEEILKEAARHTPDRLAIHSKLLDVYAKRADPLKFLASATTALQLAGPDSAEWARICELGRSIDPGNSLYQPGGQAPADAAPGGDTMPVASLAPVPQSNSDLDLDLDFSAEDAASAVPAAPPFDAFAAQQTVKMEAQEAHASNGLDFDISGPGEIEPTPVQAPEAPAAALELPQSLPDLSFAMDGLSLDSNEPPDALATAVASLDSLPDLAPPAPAPTPAVAEEEAPANASEGMLEFDLGSLSLDLGPEVQSTPEEEGSAFGDDSLDTKLALAEEFVSIGDQDGARALIEEVVAEATGELREKAQKALANLS